MMDTREWFHVTLASFTFSICSWFIFAVVYSMNPDALGSLQNFFTVSKQWRVRGTPGRLFETSIFWINAIFIGIASTIPEMCIRVYPSPSQYFSNTFLNCEKQSGFSRIIFPISLECGTLFSINSIQDFPVLSFPISGMWNLVFH